MEENSNSDNNHFYSQSIFTSTFFAWQNAYFFQKHNLEKPILYQ